MSRIKTVGDIRITGKEFREGIIDAGTWPLIFEQNNARWKALGGCELSSGVSGTCASATFNYFPTSKDAVIEWSDTTESTAKNVVASKAKGAVIDVARMPYLNHPQTFKRPTLLAFEVTGHVMLGIVYNHEGGRGPEIHILNPWSLLEDKESVTDVFTLVKEALKSAGRKVIIVDVVGELNKKYGKEINLQQHEKVGFCTLWVGILAKGVIPYLPQLHNAVKNVKAVVGSDQQLNDETLKMYDKVYTDIETRWDTILREAKKTFGEDVCPPTASAAEAVFKLARAGKRKSRRQTQRKSLYRSRWTKKRRNLR